MDLSTTAAITIVQEPAPVRRTFPVAPKVSFREAEIIIVDDGLTILEQTVVALGANDDLRSIDLPGSFARLVLRIFGGRPPNRLSDPKLEALRRYAVLIRHRRGSDEECVRFRAAGFSGGAEQQVVRLLARTHLA